MYSPGQGRFLSRDPAGEAASLNLYEYGYNDPLSWGDPDGEFVVALATVWAVVEVGLTIYDAYETYQTITDPCTGQTEKAVVTGLFVAGLLGPGGGGTAANKIGKKAAEEIAEHGDEAAEAIVRNSDVLLNTSKQLQKKFKHASDFGVNSSWGKESAKKFSEALNQHINKPGIRTLNGTYHGAPARFYVDPSDGLTVITNPQGQFVSGWKLSSQQLNHVLKQQSLGGG